MCFETLSKLVKSLGVQRDLFSEEEINEMEIIVDFDDLDENTNPQQPVLGENLKVIELQDTAITTKKLAELAKKKKMIVT